MDDAVKVTVSDPDSGEVLGERVIRNDYMLVCAGTRYLANTQSHANGTHVLTVKRHPAEGNRCPQCESEQRSWVHNACASPDPSHPWHRTEGET